METLAKHRSIFLLVVFALIFSCKRKNNDLEIFAHFKNSAATILVDTTAYKKTTAKRIFGSHTAVSFDRLKVKKQYTRGARAMAYYSILLEDIQTQTKVCRWLAERNGALFFDDTTSINQGMEQIYICCTGTNDCEPSLFVSEGKLFWTCGEKPSCSNPEKSCKISKTVLLD